MKRTEVRIPCGEITLEGIWQLPDGDGNFPAVIICHPHPLHGGNMHNTIVYKIGIYLLAHSFATLRFNFRGVGNSSGVFGDGLKEREDVTAAIDFITSQKEINAKRLGLAGYSFGGGVSIPAAYHDKRVNALALISPAVQAGGWEMMQQLKIPKMLITGSEDEYFPAQELETEFSKVPEPKNLYIIKEAGHFWEGHEGEVGEKVSGFFKEYL